MKKLFVSVPMRGRAEEEIKKSITKMHKIAELFEGEELELIDSYIPDMPKGIKNLPVWCLGRSIQKMSEADIFIGVNGSWRWTGCEHESRIAEQYGLKVCFVDPWVVIDNYQNYINEPVDPVCDNTTTF